MNHIKTWQERLGNSPHIVAAGAVGEAMQAEIDDLRAALLQSTADTKQADRVPMTDDAIWKNDAIMAANSGYGANFDTLREIVRAIEAAHGITQKGGAQ